jgi:hypothetical protein
MALVTGAAAGAAAGQLPVSTYLLEVTVLDPDGAGVGDASVSVTGAAYAKDSVSGATDVKGKFFTPLRPGSHTVTVTRQGFAAATRRVTMNAADGSVTFRLERDTAAQSGGSQAAQDSSGATINTLLGGAVIAGISILLVIYLVKRRSRNSAREEVDARAASTSLADITKRESQVSGPSAQEAAAPPDPSAKPAARSHVPSPPPGRGAKIFISYRRDDSADVTGRIYDRLVERFGKAQVFKDVDSIPLGVDFRKHLHQVVGSCDILLAVMGDRWLTAGGPEQRTRLEDAKDFVRIELEAALQRNIPIVPVLVRGGEVPDEGNLPPSLADIAYRNGLAVRPDPDFHHDMDRLIQGVVAHLSSNETAT